MGITLTDTEHCLLSARQCRTIDIHLRQRKVVEGFVANFQSRTDYIECVTSGDALRKGLRRVMCLPPATHCYLLPLLSGTLPVFPEICKRSERFVLSCLFSRSSLVRSITRHGIAARYESVIGRNALVCCKWFDWPLTDFIHGTLSLSNTYFWQHFLNKITDAQTTI